MKATLFAAAIATALLTSSVVTHAAPAPTSSAQTAPDYFTAYPGLRMERDERGILVVTLHTKGGPLTFTAKDHTDFGDAFYRISQDRDTKILIFTGAGGDFIPSIDFSSFGNVFDPGVWSQVQDEGVQILENLANIRVPVLAAVESRTYVQSEYALMADVIVAGQGATFNDLPHFGSPRAGAWYRKRCPAALRSRGPGNSPRST